MPQCCLDYIVILVVYLSYRAQGSFWAEKARWWFQSIPWFSCGFFLWNLPPDDPDPYFVPCHLEQMHVSSSSQFCGESRGQGYSLGFCAGRTRRFFMLLVLVQQLLKFWGQLTKAKKTVLSSHHTKDLIVDWKLPAMEETDRGYDYLTEKRYGRIIIYAGESERHHIQLVRNKDWAGRLVPKTQSISTFRGETQTRNGHTQRLAPGVENLTKDSCCVC